MARRLFTVLSAASLVLFAATCVLWVRSRYSEDFMQLPDGAGFWWRLQYARDHLVLDTRTDPDIAPDEFYWQSHRADDGLLVPFAARPEPALPLDWQCWGTWAQSVSRWTTTAVPYRGLAAVWGVRPVLWLTGRWRRYTLCS